METYGTGAVGKKTKDGLGSGTGCFRSAGAAAAGQPERRRGTEYPQLWQPDGWTGEHPERHGQHSRQRVGDEFSACRVKCFGTVRGAHMIQRKFPVDKNDAIMYNDGKQIY